MSRRCCFRSQLVWVAAMWFFYASRCHWLLSLFSIQTEVHVTWLYDHIHRVVWCLDTTFWAYFKSTRNSHPLPSLSLSFSPLSLFLFSFTLPPSLPPLLCFLSSLSLWRWCTQLLPKQLQWASRPPLSRHLQDHCGGSTELHARQPRLTLVVQ